MASSCRDIIINISGYDPTSTYLVQVRLVDSIAAYPVIPTYTKTATSPTVLFSGLPDAEYEVAIRRTCADGSVTPWLWQTVSSASCAVPVGYSIGSITGTGATLSYTAAGTGEAIQYRLDKKSFFVDGGASSQVLTGLTTGKVYEAEIRRKCTLYDFSLPLLQHFATVVAVPTFRVDVIEKVCEGSLFIGYRLRFSVTGDIAPASTYRISFTDIFGNSATIKEFTTGATPTVYETLQALASPFSTINFIVGTDYGCFDIISRELKVPPGMTINCQDVDLLTGYSVAIV